ncbi:MAG TPA: mechanosensitive ion channel, partial [Sedimentisphaerales bacterium]|nr:mechanosensitive ion channel [Sedimentisphaerales bacterium]
MQEQLRAILPYVQNITLALGVLFLAYVLTLPLKRRYASSEGIEVKRHSARQFIGILLTYPAFSVLVVLLSLPALRWFYHAPEPPDTKPYAEAWLLFWGIHAVVRLLEGLLVEMFVQMGRVCPLSRLSRGLLHLAIMMGVAFMLIKYQLGFEIGVLLTSTAIVTGVIGFAMQGVLGNLLAGMSLHACHTLAVGEWIHVEGVKGQVILVNWRETRVRTLGGHVVIIPNSKIADAKIYNYSSPTSLRRHEVLVAA